MVYLPHLVDFSGKCRLLYHTWILWAYDMLLTSFLGDRVLPW